MKKHFLLVVAAILCSCLFARAYVIKDDLRRLDMVLEKSSDFISTKESRISSLEKMLDVPGNTMEQKYGLLEMIYEEYYPYKYDMARVVLDRMEEIAVSQKLPGRRTDIVLERANLLCTAGLFLEAKSVIDLQLDTLHLTPSQSVAYYNVMQRYCGDYREFSSIALETRRELSAQQAWYRNRILDLLQPEDGQYRQTLMSLLLGEGRYQEALNIESSLASSCRNTDHEYALFTYFMGLLCYETGNIDDAIHWYVESAICDVSNAVKDNASIFSLAKLLIDQGEEKRAFRYTQAALDDALFYNARLRPFQIAAALPEIQKAYDARRDAQARNNTHYFVLILVLSLAIIAALTAVIRFNAKRQETRQQLSEAERELREAVLKLQEANSAKEEYLGLFLSMCSSYLDKLRKHIGRSEMDEELKVFYNTFDNAFLHLYPDFVTDFNSLLREEERIILKSDEILNTELRIFALIRLGITQSSHIASLLRYSVNTIYNYRAQVKKLAIGDVETFEERVRNL